MGPEQSARDGLFLDHTEYPAIASGSPTLCRSHGAPAAGLEQIEALHTVG